MTLSPQQQLDLRVAYAAKARALEELFFCTLHPELTGPGRRLTAIETYAQACVRIEEVKP